MDDTVRLLIAGGSADAAARVARALEDEGFRPDGLEVSGPESLAAALDGQRWDALIADLDVLWPEGHTPLELVRSRGLDLPVLLLIDTLGVPAVTALMRAGARDVLPKANLRPLAPALAR